MLDKVCEKIINACFVCFTILFGVATIAACVLMTLTIIITTVRSVKAQETSFKYGIGVINQKATGSSKTFSLQTSSPILYNTDWRYNVEVGVNPDSNTGHKTSAFTSAQLGVRPSVGGIYAEGYWGPCIITSPDNQLGGRFQFKSDAGIGILGFNSAMGLTYTHVSSAGISTPNKGRDYVGLKMTIRFE